MLIAYGRNQGWLMRHIDANSFIWIRAQCFVKLADEIVFWVNQLMAIVLLYFEVVIKVHMPTWEPAFGRSRGPLLKVCGWQFGSLHFSYNRPLSSGSLLAWVDH